MLRNDWKSQLPRSCLSPKRDRSIKQTATVVQEVTLLVAKSHLLLQIWRFSDLVSTIHAQVVLLLYRDHIPACHASSGNEDSQRNIHPSAPQGDESLPCQEKKRLYWTTNLFRWYSMIITAHCGRTNTNFVHREICFRVLDCDFVGYFVYCTSLRRPLWMSFFLSILCSTQTTLSEAKLARLSGVKERSLKIVHMEGRCYIDFTY
jgi:hypothetical protein